MLRSKKRRVTLAAAVILALVWLLWPDRQMARVRAIQAELGDAALTDEQRRDKFRELREAMNKLSPAQRDQMRDGQRDRMTDELKRYAALSPLEKRQYLDKRIDRDEEMRRRMSQPGAQPKAGTGGPPGGGPRGGGGGTPEDRERRRSAMLDRTTPEFRGLMDQMRRDMDARRKQRGLPPSSGGRRP